MRNNKGKYIGLRVSPELYESISAVSQAEGRSMSFIVRDLVSAGVANRGRQASTAAGKSANGGRHG